jgi:hypothetical protein
MTINAGDRITASSYNTMQSQISSILGLSATGYGVGSQSSQVQPGQPVTAQHWINLLADTNNVLAHQAGLQVSVPTGTTPTRGTPINHGLANVLQSTISSLVTNIYAAPYSNQITGPVTNSSTRTSAWGSTIAQQVNFLWSDAYHIDGFFNSGGYFKVTVSYNPATVSGSATDTGWKAFLDGAITTNVASFIYKRSDFIAGSGQKLLQLTDSTTNNKFNIIFNFVGGNQLQTAVQFIPVSGQTVNINVSASINYYYSTNQASPVGITSPLPGSVNTISNLNGGGGVVPAPTIRFAASPTSLTFSSNPNVSSNAQVITLTNSGTQAGKIWSATPTSSGANVLFQAEGNPSYPITIAPSGSQRFDLAYNGPNIGTFNNSVAFVVDTDPDPITQVVTSSTLSVPTTLTIAAVPFSFTLNPSSVSGTITTNAITYTSFIINANSAFTTYSATINGGSFQSAWSVDLSNTSGPTVNFNPSGLTNNTYTATLSVVVNGVTVTAPISVVVVIPASSNVGYWLGPMAANDAVIGVSYDVIEGLRYVTVGVGAGASEPDGVTLTPWLNAGGIPLIQNYGLTNLRYDAGPNYYYWSEIYKFPILANGTPATYQSINYMIKQGNLGGNTWTSFFGSGVAAQSLITCTDDGFGNVSLAINPNATFYGNADVDTSITSFNYAFYYYVDPALITRYNNNVVASGYGSLSNNSPTGDGTQTYLFTGFNASGKTLTSLVQFPVATPVNTDTGNGE